jgi:hypothetical protein
MHDATRGYSLNITGLKTIWKFAGWKPLYCAFVTRYIARKYFVIRNFVCV